MGSLAPWGPTVVAAIILVFTYGRQSQRLDDHAGKLKDQEGRLDVLDGHVNRIDLALVRLEEYQRGFADATRLAAGKEAK